MYVQSAISQLWTNDADGRLLRDIVINPDTSFPRWVIDSLRAAQHRYDGRDKLLWRSDSIVLKDTTQLQYSGLGTLTNSKFTQAGVSQGWGPNTTVRFGSADVLVVDPLGNITNGATYDTTFINGFPQQPVQLPRNATYQAATGRILTTGASLPGLRTFYYDSSGNEAFSSLIGDAGGTNPSEDRRSYYDASGRLVAAEWRFLPSQGNPGTWGYKRAFEEYRHDPLGRRIWVRAQRDCYLIPSTMPDLSGLSIECSRSFVRRTIWDGQQELAEIQAPDNATDRETDGSYFSAQALINGKDPNPYYGRVIYTYGHTIDQPLSIFRLGYADWPQGGSYTTSAWGTFAVMPFWDAMGNAKIGTFGNGAAVRQLVPSPPPPPTQQCTNPNNSPQRCVKLYWPESFTALDRLKGFTPQMYAGSLLDGKRNASGTEFKRNRVYDPKTGRFTQEDPIGLAGGLNLYGFANGDPVNFSDPFGLQAMGSSGCPGGYVEFETQCLNPAGAVGLVLTGAELRIAGAARSIVARAGNALRAWRIERRGEAIFSAAQEGGRHAGFLRNYATRPAAELRRSIRSLEARAAEHERFLRDPLSGAERWSQLTPQHQASILEGWRTEITAAREQIEILRRLLNR